MSKTFIYEPLPETAKPVAWWWAILQVPALFLLAGLIGLLVAVVFTVTAVAIAIMNGSFDPSAGAEMPGWIIGVATAGFMVGLFIGIILVSLMKIKMEKRTLASAGMNGFLYGPRFWGGFLGGIGFAVLVSVPSALLGTPTGFEGNEAEFVAGNLMTGQFVIMMIGLLIFFMIQAPAEEIFTRGWLMSALAWRHGIVLAVVFSSIVFMLLHGDRAYMGLGWLIFTFGAVGSIGVLLAAVAYAGRSVIPAAGLHTGYNFTLLGAGLTYLTGIAEDGDVIAALVELVESIGNAPDLAFTPGMIADLVLRTLIPLAIAYFLFTRRRKAA